MYIITNTENTTYIVANGKHVAPAATSDFLRFGLMCVSVTDIYELRVTRTLFYERGERFVRRINIRF